MNSFYGNKRSASMKSIDYKESSNIITTSLGVFVALFIKIQKELYSNIKTADWMHNLKKYDRL